MAVAADKVSGGTITAAHINAIATQANLADDKQPLDSDLTAIAALTTTAYGRAFLALADAAAGRTALGLGTAATAATGDFQPVDSDLTAIAALATTSFGRSLLTAADAAAARTAIGAGTSSFDGTYTALTGKPSTFAPSAHAASHASGGADVVTPAAIGAAPTSHTHTASQVSDSTVTGRAVLTAVDAAAARTATGAAATSHTHPASDLTATGTRDATTFLRGDNTWAVPAGGSSAQAPWRGKLHTCWGDGNPNQQDVLWAFQNTVVSVAAPTATAITQTVGRLVSFRYESDVIVNSLRLFTLAAPLANSLQVAIYNATTGARVVSANLPATAGWVKITTFLSGAYPFTLTADTPYWFGLSAPLASTVVALRTPASPIANSYGITTLPGNIPTHGTRFAQVALTSGAWPATLPTLAAAAFASAGTTGTLPIMYADNNSA